MRTPLWFDLSDSSRCVPGFDLVHSFCDAVHIRRKWHASPAVIDDADATSDEDVASRHVLAPLGGGFVGSQLPLPAGGSDRRREERWQQAELGPTGAAGGRDGAHRRVVHVAAAHTRTTVDPVCVGMFPLMTSVRRSAWVLRCAVTWER